MPRITPILHWSQLTRLGVPSFAVCRRPMVTLGQEIGIGEVLPAATFSPNRLRALHEARLISPISAATPEGARKVASAGIKEELSASPYRGVNVLDADLVPFDAPPVPIVEEHEHSSQSQAKAPYRPSRGVRRS